MALYASRGYCMARLERWQDALMDFDAALAAMDDDEDDISTRFNRGSVLLRLGDTTKAKVDFQRVVALAQDDDAQLVSAAKSHLQDFLLSS